MNVIKPVLKNFQPKKLGEAFYDKVQLAKFHALEAGMNEKIKRALYLKF